MTEASKLFNNNYTTTLQSYKLQPERMLKFLEEVFSTHSRSLMTLFRESLKKGPEPTFSSQKSMSIAKERQNLMKIPIRMGNECDTRRRM